MSFTEGDADYVAVSIEGLLEEYAEYQRKYRDLADGSAEKHRLYVRRCLDHFREGDRIFLSAVLRVESIQTYVAEYAGGHGDGSNRGMFSALRAFLRFCHLEGYLDADLSNAVPSLHKQRLSEVPRCISEEHVEALLKGIDTSLDIGKRDYAIIQMLNAYGVRGVHIRRLTLEDVKWADDRIVFKAAKGGKRIVQHLTPAVGNSLLDYLRYARPPQTPCREVFLTCRGVPRPLRLPATLSRIVARRLKVAGIELPGGMSKGSHPFRHAFASRMVCGSQPFKHVADMLGHKILDSTMIYTKVNLPALRQAALEWPEVPS